MKQHNEERSGPSSEIIFGRHPVVEALQEGRNLEKVLLQQGTRGELEVEVRNLCKQQGIPLVVVPKEKLQKMAPQVNHQGIVAIVPSLVYHELEDLLPLVYEKGETPLLVILDGVTDVRNLGAIARSAEAIGAHALIVPKKGSASINGDALKAAAGALHYLPVCRVDNLERCLDYLALNGVRTAAADLRGKEYLFEADLSGPIALVMGSEDRGVRPHLLRKTDVHFKIPMQGKTDSFNVSVAAGIALYEILRQRMGEADLGL